MIEWVQGGSALCKQVNDLGAIVRLTLHEDSWRVVVAHAIDVGGGHWEYTKVLVGACDWVAQAEARLHCIAKIVEGTCICQCSLSACIEE